MSSRAFVRRIVTCHCGASYERTETKLPFRVNDDFLCAVCGEVLESFIGSRVPVFNLMKRPEGDNRAGADASGDRPAP
jgi:hypothetical protein